MDSTVGGVAYRKAATVMGSTVGWVVARARDTTRELILRKIEKKTKQDGRVWEQIEYLFASWNTG